MNVDCTKEGMSASAIRKGKRVCDKTAWRVPLSLLVETTSKLYMSHCLDAPSIKAPELIGLRLPRSMKFSQVSCGPGS